MNKSDRENKVGLVLEGGGMRGLYTAGVLDVFIEQNIWPDGIIGVSAGAIHGCSYLAEQHGRSARYNVKYIKDERYVSLKSLFKTGNIFNVDFCYNQIPNQLNVFDYDKFEENAKDIPFYVGCTDVETGEPEYVQCTDFRKQMDYMRASASLPIVSKIVEVDGRKLLDGGCSDSIPVGYFRSIGYKKNVVILTRPKGYEKKPSSSYKVMEKMYSEYPEFVETNRNRYETYNRTLQYIDYYEKQGQLLVIRPTRDIKIGRIEKNIKKLKYIYRLGRRDAKAKLEEIKKFMAD